MFLLLLWNLKKSIFCMVFANICVKKDANKTPHEANINHATKLSAAGHPISEWCRKSTFNFTKITNNHSFRQVTVF